MFGRWETGAALAVDDGSSHAGTSEYLLGDDKLDQFGDKIGTPR